MKIKQKTYKNLTAKQRVIATLEAKYRGDKDEVENLINTCPKKEYKQNDIEFVNQLNTLTTMAVAIECDIRGHALNYLMAIYLDHEDAADVCLQNIADIKCARDEIIKDRGGTTPLMEVSNASYNPINSVIENLIPMPNPQRVKEMKVVLKNIT